MIKVVMDFFENQAHIQNSHSTFQARFITVNSNRFILLVLHKCPANKLLLIYLFGVNIKFYENSTLKSVFEQFSELKPVKRFIVLFQNTPKKSCFNKVGY